MPKAVRWTLLFSLIAISFAVAWDFTPRSAGRNQGKVDVKTSGPAAKMHSDRQAASQAKTLKCGECGTLNRPTEWYCERCGAELAAL